MQAVTDDARQAAARSVLTDTQFLTWAMAERGISQRAIAAYRRVSKGTVADCLREVDRKLEEAMNGKDPHTAGQAGAGAGEGGRGGTGDHGG